MNERGRRRTFSIYSRNPEQAEDMHHDTERIDSSFSGCGEGGEQKEGLDRDSTRRTRRLSERCLKATCSRAQIVANDVFS